MNGSEINSFYNPDNTVRDLAWDGECIWGVNTNGTLKKYTTEGVVVDSIPDLLNGGWGLTFENGHLWVSDPDTDRIYKIALDSTPPDPPVDLEANPANWTRVNSFSVDWINPDDESGIDGAYYKLGVPPESNMDGSYTTSKPFQVSAIAEGGEPVFVWLRDGKNNMDYSSYSFDTLFYDATGPFSGTITINNGDSVTTIRTVALSDISALDRYSGMGDGSHMKFSNDGSDWSPAEDYDSSRTGWDLAGYGGSDTPGLKRVYVMFSDVAGNWSIAFFDDIYYSPPLRIETTALLDGSVGIPYNGSLTAHGGRAPYTWDLQSGSLPDGLALNADGLLSGVPEVAGSFPFTLAVVDSVEEVVTADLSIQIHEAMKADINGDGQINILDVVAVVNNILTIVDFTPVQSWAADVNEDDQVNILDAVEIVQIILGSVRRGSGGTYY